MKGYRFLSDNLVMADVGMEMRVMGSPTYYPMIEAGNNWYDSKSSCEIILDDTEFSISEGDTVFDVLVSATKKNKIQIDYDSSNETVYVKGINGLYEFDCGELSGWMYKVNGETPNVGCSGYKLKDGDVIEWVYTANIGKDL